MTIEESKAWRPEIAGWSDDILVRYHEWAEWMPDDAVIVEVGVYRARSLRFMAERLVQLGKTRVRIYGVDPSIEGAADWFGPRESWDDWGALLANVSAAPYAEKQLIHLVRAPSVIAARMFEPRSVNLVFIDALHTTEAVREDLATWLPKVMIGGLMAGHDYGAYGVKTAVDDVSPPHWRLQETVWSWRVDA